MLELYYYENSICSERVLMTLAVEGTAPFVNADGQRTPRALVPWPRRTLRESRSAGASSRTSVPRRDKRRARASTEPGGFGS